MVSIYEKLTVWGIALVGMLFLAGSAGWLAVLGVFLMLWANNWGESWR